MWPAAKVGLERVRPVEGMAKVLAEAPQLKNESLSLFPTELPLTGSTRPAAAKRGVLEQARTVEGIAKVLVRFSSIKTTL